MKAPQSLPPTEEMFSKRELQRRHERLLPKNRLDWMFRNRRTNGLSQCGAIFESPTGELYAHEPTLLRWLFGLAGRAKPRATHQKHGTERIS